MTTMLSKFAAIVCITGAWVLISDQDYRDAETARQHYCDMVQLWSDSDTMDGWPDYDDTIDCQVQR